MIGYNAIRDALSIKLKNKYPDANIYGEEIQQGYKRPAFFMQLVPEAGLIVNVVHQAKNILVDICYFSDASKPVRDMWDIAAALDDLLGYGLKVEDRVLGIIDPQPEIIDDVMHYQFKLQFTDSQDGITIELDVPGETVTIPLDPRQEELGYIEGDIELMRELEVKEEL